MPASPSLCIDNFVLWVFSPQTPAPSGQCWALLLHDFFLAFSSGPRGPQERGALNGRRVVFVQARVFWCELQKVGFSGPPSSPIYWVHRAWARRGWSGSVTPSALCFFRIWAVLWREGSLGMTFSLLFCFISYFTFNPVLTTGFLSLSQPRFSSWVYREIMLLPCDRIHFCGSWLSWLKSSLQLYIWPQDPSGSVGGPWERKFLVRNEFYSGIIFLGGRKDFGSHHFPYLERLPM